MKDVTTANFGLLIAYVIPGFILLLGIEPHSETVQRWLGQTSAQQPSVGGFLYVTVVSITLGQLLSTVRWLVIDTIHHCTGLPKPHLSFRRLNETAVAFDRLIEDHYRYYQFHANCIVSASLASVLWWAAHDFNWLQFGGLILIDSLLFLGSRDTLRKYYQRVEQILCRERHRS